MSILPEWNNAQYQPLTIVLRNIIQDYQAGPGILLELCQNADDAGASEIEFVLDRGKYPEKDLLHHELAQYQGASLLAFNNRLFEPEDFASLRRIGDSGKADDPNSTGKFGKGFNSVYNWTDSPSILSGTYLLILDPHQTWSATPEVDAPGGPVYNFVEHSHLPQMRNQLRAFGSILKDFHKPFPGTIIRIPLRTKAQAAKTKIGPVDKHTPPKEVEEVFRTFSEELVKSLLFLKTLNTITLRIDDKIYAQATSEFSKPLSLMDKSLSVKARKKKYRQNKHKEKEAVNTAYRRVYVEMLEPSDKMDFLMNISLQNNEYPPGNERKFKYVVSHILGQGPNDRELQAWAVKNKLFPWTAIAAPLEQGSDIFKGSLFSTLPLQIGTNHPVHIHGMFSITADRLSLHFGGNRTTNQGSDAELGTRWNEWLFSQCVPQTWIQNLEYLRAISERGEYKFDAWKFWPAGSGEEWSERGTRVLGDVFGIVVERGLNLLPTICETTGTWQNVLFTLEDVGPYEAAFKEAGVAVVIPPQARRYELQRVNLLKVLTGLTPGTVRKHLTLKNNLGTLSQHSRMLLLHYSIMDEDFEDIGLCGAPLVPVHDGTFQSFRMGEGKRAYTTFLPRDQDEVTLFNKHTRTVDVAMLLPETAEIMKRNIEDLDAYTKISKWTVDAAAGYCERFIFASWTTDIIRMEGLDQFVDQLWSWIGQRNESPDSIRRSALWNMWLIPLMGGEYRRLNSPIQILDVSANRGIGAFIWKMAKKYGIRGCLFTGEGISLETAAHLRWCGFLGDHEDIEALMIWLVQNSASFVDRLNDKERQLLLHYLTGLALDCIESKITKVMKDAVANLRIFRTSQNKDWISMNGVDAQNRPLTYIGVQNIPVVLRAPGKVFVDIGDADTMKLIRTLGIADCPQPAEILERYVVPGIVNTQDDISGEISPTVIEYTLQNFNLLSAKCHASLSQAKIVPVQGPAGMVLRKRPRDTLEPNSPVASLFFLDESRVADEVFFRLYRDQLLQLGMVGLITDKVVRERIGEYGNSNRSLESIAEKAQQLITICMAPPPLVGKIRQLRWIPAWSLDSGVHLYSPHECRGLNFESLVKHTMPLVEFPINNAWSTCFGWDQPLPRSVVLRQLKGAVAANDIESLKHLIKGKHLSAEQFSTELISVEWIPSTTGKYFSPANIFLDDFENLEPYCGTLNHQFKQYEKSLFRKIGVQTAPSFQQLKELQNKLAENSPLEHPELDVALSIVKEVGKRYSQMGSDLHDFKAPDTVGIMHVISKLTSGDPGAAESQLTFLHYGISPETARQLGLMTFEDRYLGRLNDPSYEADFAQNSPMAVIEDTLRRSSISSTFTEYLANAEACGSATMICWILDESDNYPKTGLLSPGLAGVHGPALFCHNNGEFSAEDFSGIRDVGVGSTHNGPSTVGRFGKGALTMYHWTSVPSFVSGEYFVIFDPKQKYLPEHPTTRRPRVGMKIKIGELREKWPEQLRPFEGIEGFNSESMSFPGTLFRFPLPRSETKGKISILDARAILESYYDEANLSLLFLKNIDSISFMDKNSQLANWSVKSKTVEKPQVSHLTIVGEYTYPPKLGTSKSVCREWCVISGKQDDVPERLSKFRIKQRLEAEYGLAALVSEMPLGGLCGRYFDGLPLQISGNFGIPVHVNAHMSLQTDRHSISIAPGEDGWRWNKWILETGVAPLYLDLVRYLMEISGVDGYRHWPEYQPPKSEPVSKILVAAFWNLVAVSTYSLYPPNEPLPIGHTPRLLNLSQAIFNLLDTQADSDYFLSLLLGIGLETIVTPNEIVRRGLKELRPTSMRSITPEFLMDQFRGPLGNSKRLLEIWRQDYDCSIEYFNRLLSFVCNGTSLSLLVDCALLPLANRTLGVFLQESADSVYLIADSAEEREILSISEELMVHPGIESSVASRLASTRSINVRRLQSDDIKELYPRLNIDGRDDRYQKEWLVKVWSYLKTSAWSLPETERVLADLCDMQVYFGNVVGEDIDDYVFLCPSEFNDFVHAAILAPSGPTTEETSVLESFKGLILLDRSAFPESSVQKESLQNVDGVYRLLKSIELLSSTESMEAYITRVIPDRIPSLRKIFSPTIISELVKQYPQARGYLRELPLWPSMNSTIPIYQPATRALLPPYSSPSLYRVVNGNIFVDAKIARQYSAQLTYLSVEKMTIDVFLREHVGVAQDSQIQERIFSCFKALIDVLSNECPEVFLNYPLGVDGNRRFQWLSSLYSFDEPIFVAAFRDAGKFLHEDCRHFPAWKQSPLVQKITGVSYLACATSIQERRTGPEPEDELLLDAKIVFEHLCHGDRDQGMRDWSIPIWKKLAGIAFAPAKIDFDNHHHRTPRMREMVAGKTLTRITDAIALDQMDVAWSQSPVLERLLSPLVLRNLPIGHLSTSTVLNHLSFLSENRGNVTAEQIRYYVADIKESYQWLQDIPRLEDHFFVTPAVDIWFNADESGLTPEVFQASWLASQHLCIGLEHDSLPLRHVRSFLRPYYRLMKYCGVKTVKAPTISPSSHSAINHTALVLNGLQELRDESWSLDVKIVLKGREFHAHCAVLCAVSGYWRRKMRAGSRESDYTYTFPVGLKFKPESVLGLLDYIYSGKVLDTELSGIYSENLHKVIDQLYLSYKWELGGLTAKLEVSLCKGSWIRPDFVHTILKCADYVGAKDLAGFCNQYIRENHEIVHQPGFAVPSWDWYPATEHKQ